MICRKGNESRAAKPLYGNSHINTFFGHSVVRQPTTVDELRKKRLRAVTSPYEKKNQNATYEKEAKQK